MEYKTKRKFRKMKKLDTALEVLPEVNSRQIRGYKVCGRKVWSVTSDKYIRCLNRKVSSDKYCGDCSGYLMPRRRKPYNERLVQRYFPFKYNPQFVIDLYM